MDATVSGGRRCAFPPYALEQALNDMTARKVSGKVVIQP